MTPEPNHLPVTVVGSGPEANVFAQTVKDEAGDKLDVRTVATRGEAVDLLKSRDITGVYVPSAKAPEPVVATAASDLDATAVEKVFTPAADRQGVALMMVLFVMLNFTSSGGPPELQNAFFGALHAFWNGAGFAEGARSLLHFGDDGLTRDVVTLVACLLLGLAVTAIAAAYERAKAPAPAPVLAPVDEPAAALVTADEEEEEEEAEEAVGV